MKQSFFKSTLVSVALFKSAHSFASLSQVRPSAAAQSVGTLATTSGTALLAGVKPAAAAASSTSTALSMVPPAAATAMVSLDQLLSGFTIGTTIWFLFVQSLLLLKILGKEKFTPTMMKLTQRWSETMFMSASALLVVDLVLKQTMAGLNPIYALIGWVAIVVNRFIIVPKALQAGWRSQRERKGDNATDVASFAVEGGSKIDTKKLHQTVVLLVLIMLGALLGHMHGLSTLMA